MPLGAGAGPDEVVSGTGRATRVTTKVPLDRHCHANPASDDVDCIKLRWRFRPEADALSEYLDRELIGLGADD